ncbi:hypothetical protein GW17_00001784 [Ensete ventricosum]|nr:hypothetical protein GW17_00001784 [Ensete ventricosum]
MNDTRYAGRSSFSHGTRSSRPCGEHFIDRTARVQWLAWKPQHSISRYPFHLPGFCSDGWVPRSGIFCGNHLSAHSQGKYRKRVTTTAKQLAIGYDLEQVEVGCGLFSTYKCTDIHVKPSFSPPAHRALRLGAFP